MMSTALRFPESNATVVDRIKEQLTRRNNVQRPEVTSFFEVNPRLLSPLRTIARLAQLEENWDGYGSPPIRPIALASAIRFILLSNTANPPIPYVGPVTGGGIQLEWHSPTRNLELEILPDGALEYVLIDEADRIRDGEAPPYDDEVSELVSWLMHKPSKYDQL